MELLSSRATALSLVVLAVVGLAACPAADAPPTDLPHVPILPDYARGNREGCVDRRDNDGDGVFEELRRVFLDQNDFIVRRTQQIDGVGRFDQVQLHLEDGLVHDEEHFSTGADLLPNSYGNTHSVYDGEGRLVLELLEGSDARFPLAERHYEYDGDDLVLVDTIPQRNGIAGSTVTLVYDDDHELIERRVDNNRDGTDDTTFVFSTAAADDGGEVLTINSDSAEGARVDVQTFDVDQILVRREVDIGDDGDIDIAVVVDVVDGRLAGYDSDFDGDGEFEDRIDYSYDDDARAYATEEREDGVVVFATSHDFACYDDVVDHGGCAAPFVASDAFGCARFRFAPALDKARGDADVAVTDEGVLVAGGFASYPLGPIYGSYEVVAVDADEPVVFAFTDDRGAFASVDNGDGSLAVFGGIAGGVVTNTVHALSVDGVSDELPMSIPRYTGAAVRFSSGSVLLAGGIDDDNFFARAELLTSGGGSRVINDTTGAVNGTLTLAGNQAFYIGGNDGSVDNVPSDRVFVVDEFGNSFTGALDLGIDDHAAVTFGDNVLVIGGRAGAQGATTAGVLLVDEELGALRVRPETALPLPLRSVAAVALDDAHVFIAGGFGEDDEPSAATFVFDGDEWRAGPPLHIARGDAVAVVLRDGRIAVVGGSVAFGSASSAVEILELP